jgi:hypothetical protein
MVSCYRLQVVRARASAHGRGLLSEELRDRRAQAVILAVALVLLLSCAAESLEACSARFKYGIQHESWSKSDWPAVQRRSSHLTLHFSRKSAPIFKVSRSQR